MGIFCKKCQTKLSAYDHGEQEKTTKNLIKKLCSLSFSAFKESEASGGRHWYAKLSTKNKASFFIENGDRPNARIMIDGRGKPWLASLDFKDETPESMLLALQELLREKYGKES